MIFREVCKREQDLEDIQKLLDYAKTKTEKKRLKQQIIDNANGVRGEEIVLYNLASHFSGGKGVIINSLRIDHESEIAAIDHILITPSRLVFIIETKYLSGRVTSADADRWNITYDSGSRFSDSSPTDQVERHIRCLQRVLSDSGSNMKKVIPIVAIAGKAKQDLGKFDIGVDLVTADGLPKLIENKIAEENRRSISNGPPATLEEMKGCAHTIDGLHSEKPYNWAHMLGIYDAVQGRFSGTNQTDTAPEKTPPTKASKETSLVRVHGGHVRCRPHGKNNQLLVWEGEERDREAFNRECRASKNGIYHVQREGWSLPSANARELLKRMKAGKHLTQDILSPNNPALLSQERKDTAESEKRGIARLNAISKKIETRHGTIYGRPSYSNYLIKHERNDLLKKLVDNAMKNGAWSEAPRWKEEYKNWIIAACDWPVLEHAFSEQKQQRVEIAS